MIKMQAAKSIEKVVCPRCNSALFPSDFPEYAYLCKNCDENFYFIEAKTNKGDTKK